MMENNRKTNIAVFYPCFFVEEIDLKSQGVFEALSYSANNLNKSIIDAINFFNNSYIYTFISVSSFNKSKLFFIFPRRKKLESFYNLRLPVINLRFLKIFSINLVTLFLGIIFVIKNLPNKKILFSYNPDIHFFLNTLVFSLLRIERVCLVADIEFIINSIGQQKTFRNNLEILSFKSYSSYLTFNARNLIFKHNSRKFLEVPFPIDFHCEFHNSIEEKRTKKNIVFSGAIRDVYSIDKLLKFANYLEDGFHLEIYGKGELLEVLSLTSSMHMNVKYLGFVEFTNSLLAQVQATFLVIFYNHKIHHTLSFSNKLVEYLHSGTPVLVDSLDTIPHNLVKFVNLVNIEEEITSKEISSFFELENYKNLVSKAVEAKKYVESIYNHDEFVKDTIDFISSL